MDAAADTVEGLGVPRRSTDAANRADESGVEPDEAILLEDFVRKDKEAADENAS
jgi:hypothetical protein